jgi:hypothetical protein
MAGQCQASKRNDLLQRMTQPLVASSKPEEVKRGSDHEDPKK